MRVFKLMMALGALLLCSCGGGGNSVTSMLGGTVSGLVGSRLVLQTNGVDSGATIGPAGDGSYSDFFGGLRAGTAYNITVATQPTSPSQTCVVENGSGTTSDSDITNIKVTCTTNPGRFLYVETNLAQSLAGYEIDVSDGALTPINGSPFAIQDLPYHIAVDSTGSFLYVAGLGPAGRLSVFSIDRGNGALQLASVTDVGPGAPTTTSLGSVAVDPSGRFVYVSVSSCPPGPAPPPPCENHLLGFISDHGVLKPIEGSPFDSLLSGDLPDYLITDPVGRFLYVNVNGSEGLHVLRINADTGRLSTVPGSSSRAYNVVAAAPSGKFLYGIGDGISAYVVDENTGAATPVPGSPFGAGPFGVGLLPRSFAIDPRGQFVYVDDAVSSIISAYSIDPRTGALNPVPGSSFPGNITPGFVSGDLLVDPLGQFLYATNVIGGGILAYKIDRSTGAVTPTDGSPFSGPVVGMGIVISN